MSNVDIKAESPDTRSHSVPNSREPSTSSRASSADPKGAAKSSPIHSTGSRFDVLIKGNEGSSHLRSSTFGKKHPREAPSKPVVGTDAAPTVGFPPLNIRMKPPFKCLQSQPFSHILVCDFEATCDSACASYPHEIIEFPVVVLDTATLQQVAEFHAYVRPVKNVKLTSFCTELTGITQAQVDAAETLPVVVERFNTWLREVVYPLCVAWRARYGDHALSRNIASEQKHFSFDERTPEARASVMEEKMVCFATDGPWDMRRFMHECSVVRDGIEFPPVCYRYINVRLCFQKYFKTWPKKLTHMLRRLGMFFEGQPHSGIDDTRNIARVLAELLARGYRISHVSLIKYARNEPKYTALAQELLREEEFEMKKKQSTKASNRSNNSHDTSNSRSSKGKNAHRRRNMS
ncbi:unnamed protein product [Phytomonas sp. EM1]|nr:unnamed protein product [Phytomonas sp. EM1]|eukprot:CCW59574.1 unnamed protein product [Phytomonas sp. isolate EM1]